MITQPPPHNDPEKGKKGMSLRRAERIMEIQEMFNRGAKTKEIAMIYGLTQRMVQKDLQDATGLHREMLHGLDCSELLGRKIKTLEDFARYAMRQCELSKGESSKIGWSRVAKETQDTLIKLYQSTGLITQIPQRLALESDIPFENPEVRAAWLAFLKLAATVGEKNIGL